MNEHSTTNSTVYRTSTELLNAYYSSSQLPISQEPDETFVAVSRPLSDGKHNSELITLGNASSLLHIVPDQSSESGWSSSIITVTGRPGGCLPPTGVPPSKVLAFYSGDLLTIFVHFPTKGEGNAEEFSVFGMQRNFSPKSDSGWVPLPFSQTIADNSLSLMSETQLYKSEDGRVFLYGVSSQALPAFVLLGFDPTSSNWSMFYETEIEEESTYRVLPGKDPQDAAILKVGTETTISLGTLSNSSWSQSGASKSLDLSITSASHVDPVPASTATERAFLVTDKSEDLFLVTGYLGDTGSPRTTKLTGQANSPARVMALSSGVDLLGRMVAFCVESSTNKAWLIREAPATIVTNNSANWIPLGDDVVCLSCPPRMATGPEAFLYQTNTGKLLHLSQQTDSIGLWTECTVEGPAPASCNPDKTPIYSYRCELSGATDIPMSGETVEVFADQKTVCSIDGITYHIDTVTAATVTTDSFGCVTVYVKAGSMASPELIVMHNKETVASIRAQHGVIDRLAGQEGFKVDSSALAAAGLIAPNWKNTKAGNLAAEKLQSIGKASLPLTAGESPNETRSDSSLKQTVQTTTDLASIGHLIGDALHFLEKIVDKLDSIALKGITLTIKVAESAIPFTFVLNHLGVVGKALDIVFKHIAFIAELVVDALKLALAWLALLFDWGSIINTHKAISSVLTSCLEQTKTGVPTFFEDLQKTLEDMKKSSNSEFQKIIASIDPSETLSQLAKVGNGPAGGTASGSALRGVYHKHAVRCDYLRSHIVSGLATQGSPPTTVQEALSEPEPTQLFLEEFTKNLTKDIKSAGEKVLALWSNVHSLSGVLEASAASLLELVEALLDSIIDFLAAMASALGALVTYAIDHVLNDLSHHLHIPIVTWLYNEVTGDPLTIIDAVSLLLAIPITILSELMLGIPPISAAAAEKLKDSPIQLPALATAFNSSSVNDTEDTISALPQSNSSDLTKGLCTTASFLGLVYGFFDVAYTLKSGNKPLGTLNSLAAFAKGGFSYAGATMAAESDRDKTVAQIGGASALILALPTLFIFCSFNNEKREEIESVFSVLFGVITIFAPIVVACSKGKGPSWNETLGAVAAPLVGISKGLAPVAKDNEIALFALGAFTFVGDTCSCAGSWPVAYETLGS